MTGMMAVGSDISKNSTNKAGKFTVCITWKLKLRNALLTNLSVVALNISLLRGIALFHFTKFGNAKLHARFGSSVLLAVRIDVSTTINNVSSGRRSDCRYEICYIMPQTFNSHHEVFGVLG